MSAYPEGVEVLRCATLSEDNRYRYTLTRAWGVEPGDETGLLPFIMLNPSSADAFEDDPTILRCVGLARARDYTGIFVLNLYAFRTPKPSTLWRARNDGIDVVGPENDHILTTVFEAMQLLERPVVAAWGAAPQARDRIAEVCQLPGADNLHAFRLTAGGQPWHPLYLPGDCELTPWQHPPNSVTQ